MYTFWITGLKKNNFYKMQFRHISQAFMKLERVVGKIVELERLMLIRTQRSSMQGSVYGKMYTQKQELGKNFPTKNLPT